MPVQLMELLALQEAFKPSPVIPELFLALYLKRLVFWINFDTKSVILYAWNRVAWLSLSSPKPKYGQDGWPLLM